MRCAWQEVLRVIPSWMRREVDNLGKDHLQELRLRLGKPPELRLGHKQIELSCHVSQEDLNFVVNTGSHYSPWAAATITQATLHIIECSVHNCIFLQIPGVKLGSKILTLVVV